MSLAGKRGALKKFAAILLLILIFVVIAIVGFNFAKPFISSGLNETNSTLINVQQNQQITNIDQRGQTNFWDGFIIFVVVAFSFGILFFVFKWLFKFLSGKKLLSNKRKDECELKGADNFLEKGFPLGLKKAKASYKYYGVDSESNLTWVFIFFRNTVPNDSDVHLVDKKDLFSCFVDGKTLEVWDESSGKDMKDIKKELNAQRFGKESVPNYPGKTEKQPSIGDLFDTTKPSVTFSPDNEEET